MLKALCSFFALFSAVLILLTGVGVLGTLLSLRMTLEGYSEQATGLVLSGYYIGVVIGCLYCRHLIRRVGHIRSFAAFAAVCTAAVMGHALYVSLISWGILRLLTGIAVTGLYMIIESWLNECSSSAERGRVFSVYMVMSYLGLGFGQLLLLSNDLGGQNLFLVSGILLALCLVPVTVTHAISPQAPERIDFDFLREIKKAPLGFYGSLTAGLANGAIYCMAPVFAHQIGLPVSSIALFMGIIIFSGLLLQWPIGVLSDRLDRNLVMAGVGLAVTLTSIGIMLTVDRSEVLLFAAAVLYGGSAFTLYPVAVAHTHDFFEPTEIVSVSSILLMSFGVGAILGPIAAAALMGALGPTGLFVFIAAVNTAFAATVYLFRRQKPERLEVTESVKFRLMRPTSTVAGILDPRSEPGGGEPPGVD